MSETEYDRARRLLTRAEKVALPRRFYKDVNVGGEASFQILLDGRPVKTPLKAPLALANRSLAKAVAAEWDAQGEHIDPATMPHTRLSNTAIDRVGVNREGIVAEIIEYAGNDLVCYRAHSPKGLVERQNETWDPLLAWMAKELGARFVSVTGLVHEPQPEPTLQAITGYLECCGDFSLTALHNLTSLTGSCVLAITLREDVISAQAGWAAAHVDEDWQILHWGTDDEAAARRESHEREFDATLAYLQLAGDS